MNPFESGVRRVIPACLVYARAGGHLLMIHRNGKGERAKTDVHAGKWNGLGGKFELDESPVEAARREFAEEAGLDLSESSLRSLGVLQFPAFKPGEDWVVFVFSAELDGAFPEGRFKTAPEGDLHWVPEKDVLGLPLWEGDRLFLPYVLERRPFVGTFWYEGGRMRRHWLEPLSR